MPSTDLPAHVQAALSTALDGVKRDRLVAATAAMSNVYRDDGHSDQAVASGNSALAYAIARMPATYAAAIRVFAEVQRREPDFAPRALEDVGAGPGTATLAALAVWPSLKTLTLIEPNPHMRALSKTFLAGNAAAADRTVRIYESDIIGRPANDLSDLVVMSYVLAEHPAERAAALAAMAARQAADILVIIEPGRTAGFERIKRARDALAVRGTMHIIAPCPHANACPLPAPDWCHFSVRLARSRDHKLLKGADAPFEDEAYSYVAMTRSRPRAAAPARVLRPPSVSKAEVALRLCTADGLSECRLPRRDKPGYKAAKGLDWGDTFDPVATSPPESSS